SQPVLRNDAETPARILTQILVEDRGAAAVLDRFPQRELFTSREIIAGNHHRRHRRAAEDEIAEQVVVDRRALAATRGVEHALPYTTQNLAHGEARLSQRAQQLLGEQAVRRAWIVAGGLPGSGRERHEAALRFHRREATAGRPLCPVR